MRQKMPFPTGYRVKGKNKPLSLNLATKISSEGVYLDKQVFNAS